MSIRVLRIVDWLDAHQAGSIIELNNLMGVLAVSMSEAIESIVFCLEKRTVCMVVRKIGDAAWEVHHLALYSLINGSAEVEVAVKKM